MKDEERDNGGFKPTDQQIKLVLLLQNLKDYGGYISVSGVFEEDKITAIIVALCSFPKSSKTTVFVPLIEETLQKMMNHPMVTKRLIEGKFSLLKGGIPENPRAHVWVTDLHGLEKMTHTPNNPYLKKIGSVWIDGYLPESRATPLFIFATQVLEKIRIATNNKVTVTGFSTTKMQI